MDSATAPARTTPHRRTGSRAAARMPRRLRRLLVRELDKAGKAALQNGDQVIDRAHLIPPAVRYRSPGRGPWNMHALQRAGKATVALPPAEPWSAWRKGDQ